MRGAANRREEGINEGVSLVSPGCGDKNLNSYKFIGWKRRSAKPSVSFPVPRTNHDSKQPLRRANDFARGKISSSRDFSSPPTLLITLSTLNDPHAPFNPVNSSILATFLRRSSNDHPAGWNSRDRFPRDPSRPNLPLFEQRRKEQSTFRRVAE